jgi:hypothetical protein
MFLIWLYQLIQAWSDEEEASHFFVCCGARWVVRRQVFSGRLLELLGVGVSHSDVHSEIERPYYILPLFKLTHQLSI